MFLCDRLWKLCPELWFKSLSMHMNFTWPFKFEGLKYWLYRIQETVESKFTEKLPPPPFSNEVAWLVPAWSQIEKCSKKKRVSCKICKFNLWCQQWFYSAIGTAKYHQTLPETNPTLTLRCQLPLRVLLRDVLLINQRHCWVFFSVSDLPEFNICMSWQIYCITWWKPGVQG